MTMLLSAYAIVIKAEAPKATNDASSKIVKSKEIRPIKTGDTLALSEFTKLNNGIMYQIVKQGSGEKSAHGRTVTVHYNGYLLNGKKVGDKFDSSLDRNAPFSFTLGAKQVISGWDISVADMKNGEIRIVILPAEYAYGNRSIGSIPAQASLIFEISILDNGSEKNSTKKSVIPIKSGDTLTLSEFTKTNTGIMYKIVKEGLGEKPLQGENVVVNYSGYLLVDGKKVGTKFDSSFDRNMPFSFKLGARQVITGWEISLAEMKVGETRVVILPSKHAYGSRTTSKIPADSSLI
ncbi:MAG: FKBP-type peptidyl-prolyl cis-trans isomerase, partial [Flavobacterium sp.]|nr:FKBP-type peptidyl-prolyl cis-trans isomerase [Flavobacterium sp.]